MKTKPLIYFLMIFIFAACSAIQGMRFIDRGEEFEYLIDNRDGTVTDTENNLMWQQKNAGKMRWKQAINYCENLSFAGYDDWRLPTREELVTLGNKNRQYRDRVFYINIHYFPDIKTNWGPYWASPPDTYNSDDACGVAGFMVYDSGLLSWFYVRAVRTIKNRQFDKFDNLVVQLKNFAVDRDEPKAQVVIEDIPDFVVDIEQNLPKTKMKNKDGIAVVIGNKNYQQTKKVDFAINDAMTMKKYLVEVIGYREGNVFFKKDAFKGDFETFFGTDKNHRGKLYNAVKRNKSDVFIYYSGHGAPGQKDRRGYFVPVNADPQYVELAGYSADTFFKNLSKIRAKSFTVVLDCCFSGAELLKDVSPMNIEVDMPVQSLKNGVILTSSKGTQFSSWYREKKHGMFTYFFLKAIHSKKADFDGNNKLTFGEIFRFVSDKSDGVPYFARRFNGVEQTPTIDGLYQKTLVVY
ncbi:hypothetical protein GMMP15_1530042 [Candidatus Magnetomoraceae bacterium gMMP-15]